MMPADSVFVASVKGIPKPQGIVQQALMILQNLDHRGAVGADPLLGDGAGILIQILTEFFSHRNGQAEYSASSAHSDYGVGMIFLSLEEHASRRACEQEIEKNR